MTVMIINLAAKIREKSDDSETIKLLCAVLSRNVRTAESSWCSLELSQA